MKIKDEVVPFTCGALMWLVLILGLKAYDRLHLNKEYLSALQRTYIENSMPQSDIQYGVDDQDRILDATYVMWMPDSKANVVTTIDYPYVAVGMKVDDLP